MDRSKQNKGSLCLLGGTMHPHEQFLWRATCNRWRGKTCIRSHLRQKEPWKEVGKVDASVVYGTRNDHHDKLSTNLPWTRREGIAPIDWMCSASGVLDLALPHHWWDGHRLQPMFLSTQCFSAVLVQKVPVVVTPLFHYFESFLSSPFGQPRVKFQDTLCHGLPLFSPSHVSAITASLHVFLCHGLGLRQRCAYGGGNAHLTYTHSIAFLPWVSGALGLHRVSLVLVSFFSRGGLRWSEFLRRTPNSFYRMVW